MADDAGLLDAIDVLGVFDEAEGDTTAPADAPEIGFSAD